ncbi:phosphatase PAP2 family protein [Variovorax sp. RA8]|uniref:phosphatase PAP2 family protein n=1 Tax=Variovorax sp. (strain JCM 16519 / RA8) TaxID=662548 RepID=UPI00131976C6|nr:phosphatase PAP2 family protein [Variovorax sp. RA8]VTU14624.1 PAP2 superfamily protein [Variovorax sp. RA8]
MLFLPDDFWYSITWFGDSGFLLPVAAWIAVWLGVRTVTRPVAWRWLALFGSAGALVAASKIAFMGWGIGSATLNFTGISGHTMLSTSIWPVAFWLVAAHWRPRVRAAVAALGWVFAALIGLSRLAIYAHSKSEVAAGFLLGAAVSAVFLWRQHHRPPRLHWVLLLISIASPLLFLRPGTPAPTHDALEVIAVRLAGAERAFTRDDLLRRRQQRIGTD